MVTSLLNLCIEVPGLVLALPYPVPGYPGYPGTRVPGVPGTGYPGTRARRVPGVPGYPGTRVELGEPRALGNEWGVTLGDCQIEMSGEAIPRVPVYSTVTVVGGSAWDKIWYYPGRYLLPVVLEIVSASGERVWFQVGKWSWEMEREQKQEKSYPGYGRIVAKIKLISGPAHSLSPASPGLHVA
eukprot:3150589-Rhodomonas_salina.1